jgi:ParB/Sulfiredoxin domain
MNDGKTQVTMKIHPAAECVRLMDEDEFAALVEDIKERGQLESIVVARVKGAESDAVADGRNRLRACEAAGIEPRFEIREFEDDEAVKAFVNSREVRRSVTKGQQAMRHALLYPEPEKGGRGHKKKGGETPGFSAKRLYDARTVLAYSRELALKVRDGGAFLDEALKEVTLARGKTNDVEDQLAKLRDEAPDLADLVTEQRMKLSEAVAALTKRKEEEAFRRSSVTQSIAESLNSLDYEGHGTADKWTSDIMEYFDEERWPSYADTKEFSLAIIERAIASLEAFAAEWRKAHGEDGPKKKHRSVGNKKAR